MIQMFVPSVSRPTRQQVEKEIQKVYPDSKVLSFLPKELEPGEPTVMVGEGANDFIERRKEREIKRQETNKAIQNTRDSAADKRVADAKKDPNLKKLDQTMGEENLNEISLETATQAFQKANKKFQYADDNVTRADALRQKGKFAAYANRKAKKLNQDRSDIRKSFEGPDAVKEENISEDDMKGMSVKSGHKRSTKSGAGMTAKGVAAYRRRNPGSKLKTAVTGKVKKGSKDAKRRKSYCARSAGQMKKFPKAAKDPNSRLRQARRRWKC